MSSIKRQRNEEESAYEESAMIADRKEAEARLDREILAAKAEAKAAEEEVNHLKVLHLKRMKLATYRAYAAELKAEAERLKKSMEPS